LRILACQIVWPLFSGCSLATIYRFIDWIPQL